MKIKHFGNLKVYNNNMLHY